MKLVFKDIAKKKCRYLLNEGTWLTDELSERLSHPIAKIVTYRRDAVSVVIEGSLQAERSAVCDRCGDAIAVDLQTDFYYLVTTEPEENSDDQEVDCSGEDAQILRLHPEKTEIDVAALLQEQTFLAIPVRALCSEECKGICPGCGATLNSEKCTCDSVEESSPFAVLKELYTNNN